MAESRTMQGARDLDIRRRIEALTADIQPAEEIVLNSIKPLEDKLGRQSAARQELLQLREAHRKPLAMFDRGDKKNPGKKETEVIRAYREALLNQAAGMAVKPPVFPKTEPLIKSGPIITLGCPPYNSRWTHGSGAFASFINGTWLAAGTGSNISYAGACAFFTPPAGRFPVRFSPSMPINYSYLIGTFSYPFFPFYYSMATVKGFVGIFVSASRDGGHTWEEVVDVRQTIFERKVSIRDSESHLGENETTSLYANFVTIEKPALFALWGWGGVETWEWSAPGGFAIASANIAASIPFMVIEQHI